MLQGFVKYDLSQLEFMHSMEIAVGGVDGCRVSRCGYTGEDGFEVLRGRVLLCADSWLRPGPLML